MLRSQIVMVISAGLGVPSYSARCLPPRRRAHHRKKKMGDGFTPTQGRSEGDSH